MSIEKRELAHSPEGSPEIHRAVAEKIQAAISAELNRKIEQIVERVLNKDDITVAAEQLFAFASRGKSESEIESEIKRLASGLASQVLERT